MHAFGTKGFFRYSPAAVLLPAIFFGARKLVINRDRLHITTFLSSLVMIPGCAGNWAGLAAGEREQHVS